MSRVVVSVETDEVAVQDAQQQLISHGQDPIDLARGEGCVQEEANLDVLFAIANLLPEHFGQEHQVVIMHPDQIPIAHFRSHCLGEQSVCFLVSLPGGLIESDFTGVIVEERPQDRVCREVAARQLPSNQSHT